MTRLAALCDEWGPLAGGGDLRGIMTIRRAMSAHAGIGNVQRMGGRLLGMQHRRAAEQAVSHSWHRPAQVLNWHDGMGLNSSALINSAPPQKSEGERRSR